MNKRYSHDNWNQVWNMPPGLDRDRQLKTVGCLAKGNLHWFIRRLIGGTPNHDQVEWIEKWIAEGIMLRSVRHKERYETFISQDQ